MKVVILAGGYGTRLSEETSVRPKPMVEIGERPILWHIMKIYAAHGLNEFVICCGYKGHVIKEFFANYYIRECDVTFDMRSNKMEVHQNSTDPWLVTLVDTGEKTMTGGRLKRVKEYLGNETFCLTYGDGVSDINIADLVSFHKEHGALATVTAVQPVGRFGVFGMQPGDDRVTHFREKPGGDGGWINGGFFVLEPGALDYIVDDSTVWEREPLERLATEGQLIAYRHTGFWHPMDTLRDKNYLEERWDQGDAPWRIW